jgi:hypothetical protein
MIYVVICGDVEVPDRAGHRQQYCRSYIMFKSIVEILVPNPGPQLVCGLAPAPGTVASSQHVFGD